MTITAGLIAPARISLFEESESNNDHASFTVAHQKANRILESFQNPFRMYLPSSDVHVNKTAKLDPSTKMYEISKRWKLQSIEQQQREMEIKKAAKQKAREQKKLAAAERQK